jgi:DNA helicase II / ATP-dependent DNA helicase PcrA
LQKSVFDGDWDEERARLSTEEGHTCFDLFAQSVANLLERSSSVRSLIARKYPFIIVDEFQDTDDDQWRIVQSLAESSVVFCLADPEQRIFEYRHNVDPKRTETLRESLKPTEVDLGGENHRSPTAGILQFADAVLQNGPKLPETDDVKIINYRGKSFESLVHAGVLWTFSELRKRDVDNPCVAVLCRSNSFVAKLSILLSEEHTFKTQTLKPVEHDVVWDADLAAAAAQVVGTVLEWPGKSKKIAVGRTLDLLAHYYRLKNAESPSKGASESARRYAEAMEAVAAGELPRLKVARQLLARFDEGLTLIGDPVEDWRLARSVLRDIKGLNDVFKEARMVRLFRVTDALGEALDELWLKSGSYVGTCQLIKRVLDRERLLAADRDPRGCILMTMHKSKGKEFDGVVLVEGHFSSPFFDQNREKPPYERSRRLLRVGITRARYITTIIRSVDSLPLVG